MLVCARARVLLCVGELSICMIYNIELPCNKQTHGALLIFNPTLSNLHQTHHIFSSEYQSISKHSSKGKRNSVDIKSSNRYAANV